MICDSKALPYARKRIARLETKPYTALPIHRRALVRVLSSRPSMTRTQSRQYKMELLKLIGDLSGMRIRPAAKRRCRSGLFRGYAQPRSLPRAGFRRNLLPEWDEVPERLA